MPISFVLIGTHFYKKFADIVKIKNIWSDFKYSLITEIIVLDRLN